MDARPSPFVPGMRVKWLDDKSNIQYGLFLSYLDWPWAMVESNSTDLIINRNRLFQIWHDFDKRDEHDWISSDSE